MFHFLYTELLKIKASEHRAFLLANKDEIERTKRAEEKCNKFKM